MVNHTNVDLPLPPPLLQDAQQVAKDLKLSWPRLIVVALQEFVQRYQARKNLLARLNETYADGLDDQERVVLKQMRSHHRKLVEREW